METNELLEAALGYAARGWPVHPLRDADKRPRLQDWPNAASTDPATIRGWWRQWPSANIGIVTGARSGLLVLDVDGPEGAESTKGRDLPPTVTAVTPKGYHFYYVANGGRNSVGQLGEGLDVRADGGYVVAPPSRNGEGGYAWQLPPADMELSDVPAWIMGPPPGEGALTVQARETVADLLASGSKIPAGRRNQELTRIAGSLRRAGLDTSELFAALTQVNVNRCTEPLDAEELATIANSIGRKPVGEDARVVDRDDDQGLRLRLEPVSELLRTQLAEVEHLVGSLHDGCVVEEGSLIFLHGKPRSWKSWAALLIALCVATGRPWLGRFPTKRGRVVYIQAEGGRRNWIRRLKLCASAIDCEAEELEGQFLTAAAGGFALDDEEAVDDLIDSLREWGPALIVLDPLAALHGQDENDTGGMGRVIRALRRVQTELGCTMLVVHHDRKGEAPTRRAEALRGSSALWAAGSTIGFTRQGENGAGVFVEQKDAESPEAFSIHFDFDGDSMTVSYGGKPLASETIDSQEKVMAVLAEGPATSAEIRERTGFSKTTVGRVLKDLQDALAIAQVDRRGHAVLYGMVQAA